jgi:hypothetical protein
LVEEGRQTVDETLADRCHSKFVRRRAAGHEPGKQGAYSDQKLVCRRLRRERPVDVFSVSRTLQTTQESPIAT